MNQVQTVNHKTDAVTLFKDNIARQEREFRAALPAHIPVERFLRVLTTAVVNNPDLLSADRRSLFESAMKAAHDGLFADGREGALVIFNAKSKVDGKDQWIKKVQWMPMIAGILKKVRNSGELQSISAHVVYSNDDFSYALGDDERIEHRPALDNRGAPRLLYAIAKLKDGGIYREIMTVADVEKVRAISRSKESGPWVSWWDEMARKTVLRRLSKRLPMSSDLDDFLHRDYDMEGERAGAGSANHLASRAMAETPTRRLTSDLDAIAAGGNDMRVATGEEFRKAMEAEEDPRVMAAHDPETGEVWTAEQVRADHEARILEERAQAANSDPSQSSNAKEKDAGEVLGTPTPASDPAVERVLDAGRAAATSGKNRYKRWENNLSGPDWDRVKDNIEELRAMAAKVDGERA